MSNIEVHSHETQFKSTFLKLVSFFLGVFFSFTLSFDSKYVEIRTVYQTTLSKLCHWNGLPFDSMHNKFDQLI